jgi:hypothetical protein
MYALVLTSPNHSTHHMAIKRFVHALLLIVTTENFAHDLGSRSLRTKLAVYHENKDERQEDIDNMGSINYRSQLDWYFIQATDCGMTTTREWRLHMLICSPKMHIDDPSSAESTLIAIAQ